MDVYSKSPLALKIRNTVEICGCSWIPLAPRGAPRGAYKSLGIRSNVHGPLLLCPLHTLIAVRLSPRLLSFFGNGAPGHSFGVGRRVLLLGDDAHLRGILAAQPKSSLRAQLPAGRARRRGWRRSQNAQATSAGSPRQTVQRRSPAAAGPAAVVREGRPSTRKRRTAVATIKLATVWSGSVRTPRLSAHRVVLPALNRVSWPQDETAALTHREGTQTRWSQLSGCCTGTDPARSSCYSVPASGP